MLNLTKETKAVLLFGSVYRVRPSSLSSGCKWVKWHCGAILHMTSAWSTSAPWAACGGWFQPFHQPLVGHSWDVPALRLTFLGGCWSTAMESSAHKGTCVFSCCLVGKDGITPSPVPENLCHELPSSNSAFLTPIWFNIQWKEKLDWSHVTGPCCNLLSEHEIGSLRNNGINWGEVGALSFWHY